MVLTLDPLGENVVTVGLKMTSKRALQVIEANLDIEKLISEIQDRPTLWDMTEKDYNDRAKRKQCWEDITEVFSFDSDLSLEDKIKLEDTLHKKWKNIRDRFTRDVQERKGKSGDGALKKAPYMYSRQLEFLRDTVTPKKTANSLGRTRAESMLGQEEREEEENADEETEDELQEATSASSSRSSAPEVSRTRAKQIGKNRLHPVEDSILDSLDMYEKRTKIDRREGNVEDNDNRHFLLSLVQNLASLPRHLNTNCRIEIMQCINKYETINQKQQHQRPSTYLH